VTPGLIGSGSGSVGFEGSISGPSNLRKGPRNLRIDHIEPEPLEVSGEAFTDSMGVSCGASRFLGFGNKNLAAEAGNWLLFPKIETPAFGIWGAEVLYPHWFS